MSAPESPGFTGGPSVAISNSVASAAKCSRALALACLSASDVARKLELTVSAGASIAAELMRTAPVSAPQAAAEVAGRPERPLLVPARELRQRKLSSPEGRAALIHAVAHIEFNAINLAWDAVYRFDHLPDAYYRDWASVAVDEARHFAMLEQRLRELGHEYGDFPAHDGLWSTAVATAHDLVARMALVPRVLEARGLDVTPPMIQRLLAADDHATAAILEVILREEVRHVAIGSQWFRFACAAARLEPRATFMRLLSDYGFDRIRGPFNHAARLRAGFDELEMLELERLDSRGQSFDKNHT